MKHKLYQGYVVTGRILSYILSPLRWLLIGYTTRAYAVVEQDSRILVIKNWLHKDEWKLPGGGVHSWERAEAGLRRELFEEIGLQLEPEDVKFAKESFHKHTLGGKHYLLFHVSLANDKSLKISRSEIVDHAWIPMTGVDELGSVSEDIRAVMHPKSAK